jgi:glycosyltransferase involved in cell wall biosynthesis
MTPPPHGLTIVIPVYNEEQALPRVLPPVIEEVERSGWRLILVNDGSTDGSAELLEAQAGHPAVEVVQLRVNRGYGGALKAGIDRVRTRHVVTMDADGQHRLEDVHRLYRHCLDHDAAMVIGSRAGQRASGAYRELGKWLLRMTARLLLSFDLQDLNSGFKIYRTELVQDYLGLCPDSMAFSDIITLCFIHRKHLVQELPVTINPRAGGQSKISTATALETFYELINILMLFNPSRLFLPVAALFFIGGLAWGLPIVLTGRGVSVGALLAFTAGFFLVFTGLLAEQLSLVRRGLIASRHRSEPDRDDD